MCVGFKDFVLNFQVFWVILKGFINALIKKTKIIQTI